MKPEPTAALTLTVRCIKQSTAQQNKVSITPGRHSRMLLAGLQGICTAWIPARNTRE